MTTNQKLTSTAGHLPQSPADLTKKVNFSFKDCKAWNSHKAKNMLNYIHEHVDPDYNDFKSIDIPDNPNPWNVLRYVIEQFYQREYCTSLQRNYVRKAEERVKILESQNNQLTDQLHQVEIREQDYTTIQSDQLSELWDICTPREWTDAIDSVMNCLIYSMCHDNGVVEGADIYHTKILHDFFMKLDRE